MDYLLALYNLWPQQIGLSEYIDIALLSFIFYRLIMLLQGTRTLQIMLGGLLLVLVYFAAVNFELSATYISLNLFFDSLVIIVVVLFSDEIKRGLALLGKGSFLFSRRGVKDPYFFDRLLQACEFFSHNKVGALIVIERRQSLKQYADTGTVLDARISSPLLVSIFNRNSPLHDGAILIDKELKIHAAACILPLTSRIDLKVRLGTRHRSAIGISEETDCLALVISEETGLISFFNDGSQEIVPLDDFKSKMKQQLIGS